MMKLLTWLCLFLTSLSAQDYDRGSVVIARHFSSTGKIPDTGIRIEWDRSTLSQVSDDSFWYSSYPRMIQLKDKSLLCVYEAEGSIMAVNSTDLGQTWAEPVAVAWRQDGINMAVPDVLQLHDGSILVCYNPRPFKISGTRCFGIRTRKSYDGGQTWIHGRLLYEAGHKFENGCWEPAAIQLPDGQIQIYFADENPYRESHEQNISLLRSQDGGLTWTTEPEIISFRPGGRDGMPSPLVLNGGEEIVCAIEDMGWFGYLKPAIIRSTMADGWSTPVPAISANRHGALFDAIGYRLYAGAPCLRQLSTGETLLSYQGTEGRRNDIRYSEMKVVIGDSRAKNFNRKSVPFEIPENRFCLWNSLTILNDDTIIALTSTNAFSDNPEIWMIKGYVGKTSLTTIPPTTAP